MNQTRSKSLQKLLDQLQQVETVIQERRYDIEALRDEEHEYRDAMPESLREGTHGETADAAIEALEQAISHLEEMEVHFVEAAARIEEAMA